MDADATPPAPPAIDPSGAWPPDRRFFWIVVPVAAAGVVLRVIYVLVSVRDRIQLTGDARTYHRLARLLADGEGYLRTLEYFNEGWKIPTAEFPPLYPMTLAALNLVGIDTPLGQRLAGAVFAGVTIVVVSLVGLALAGRTVGVVAAVLAAAYPQLVLLDTSLMSEGLLVFLVAVTLLAVLRARATEGAVQVRWWLAAGGAVGLAALTRSEAILLLPLLLVPAAHVPEDRRAWLRAAAAASVGVILLVGAWTARNAVSLGHAQPFTNNSGTMLAGANCEQVYTGIMTGLWRLDCAERVDIVGLDETEAAAARREAGIEYALDHPKSLAKVSLVRVARTAGLWDVRIQLWSESLEGRAWHWLWAGWIGWIVLAPLAVAGAVIRRHQRRLVWPLLVPPAIVFALAAVTYGNQRFRALAEPSVILLAAIAIAALASAVARRLARDR